MEPTTISIKLKYNLHTYFFRNLLEVYYLHGSYKVLLASKFRARKSFACVIYINLHDG